VQLDQAFPFVGSLSLSLSLSLSMIEQPSEA